MNKIQAFILILACLFSLTHSEPTTLSYIIEVEEESGNDFIEMTIKVSAEDASLTTAIAAAK